MSEAATMERPARPKRQPKPRARATAESLSRQQRDISVSEFFAKNRHLLGFDNPRKALLTTVKEAVDNALDACEEAGTLPNIVVAIEELHAPALRANGDAQASKRSAAAAPSRYRVTIADNGPGIVRKQVEHIFGRLLYGSKFHRLKMSRGQQGIGISAAGMYGLLTTGRPMVIHTRPDARKRAHHIELAMNTKTNRAEVTVDRETDDFPIARLRDLSPGTRELAGRDELLAPEVFSTGTSVSIELEGKYQRGRGSVDEFLELTAIANPHARITFVPPAKGASAPDEEEPLLNDTKEASAPESDTQTAESEPPASITTLELPGVTVFPCGIDELPPETKEIQPHPRGIELGMLLQMLKDARQARENTSLYAFLQEQFSRVSAASAAALCKAIGVTSRSRVADIDHAAAERLFHELQTFKLPPPPTNCLAPIGVRQLLAGLLKGVKAEFYAASSRDPAVYRGRPFQIEAAIAYGGDLPRDEPARVIRFANRVPLQYQQSACSSFKAVVDTKWRNYDLQQPKGSAPIGPLVIMIHVASVWVPFTSESKEAIADYDEIRKEMKLALQECGRKLGTYLRKRAKMKREGERRDVFERYIGEISRSCEALTGAAAKEVYEALQRQAKRRTAMADQVLDDEGKVVKEEFDESVLIVEPTSSAQPEAAAAESVPGRSRAGGTAESDRAPAAKGQPAAPAPNRMKKGSTEKPGGKAERPRDAQASSATPKRAGKPNPRTHGRSSDSKPRGDSEGLFEDSGR
ncbi:MAG: DNA topoisomerase VI subunit B [Phycisphaeraceae bacterium]|nr:DNA topoisomerase VI subunit B [Phycisphaeraceae bacterium]